MVRRNINKGQQALEFILISSLILLGALVTLILLGNKLSSFYQTDSAIAVKSSKSFPTINASSRYFASNSSTTSNSTLYNTRSIEGVNINCYEDGSASFTVNGQQVNINADQMNNLNTVFQTTGSSGLNTEVVQAITDLINSNTNNYPGRDVPVEIIFGTGSRNQAETYNLRGGSYSGNAAVNSVGILVGDSFKIIQKDQDCPSQGIDHCGFVSTISITRDYRTEQASGDVNSNLGAMDNSKIYCRDFSTSGLPTSCGVASSENFGGASWTFNYPSQAQSI